MEERAATVRDNLARESNPTSPAGNTVFLQDRGIAALPHFFGKCYTILAQNVRKHTYTYVHFLII